jgi:hypothetical protein
MLENCKCIGKTNSTDVIYVSGYIKTCQLDRIYWKGHTNGYGDSVNFGFFVDAE